MRERINIFSDFCELFYSSVGGEFWIFPFVFIVTVYREFHPFQIAFRAITTFQRNALPMRFLRTQVGRKVSRQITLLLPSRSCLFSKRISQRNEFFSMYKTPDLAKCACKTLALRRNTEIIMLLVAIAAQIVFTLIRRSKAFGFDRNQRHNNCRRKWSHNFDVANFPLNCIGIGQCTRYISKESPLWPASVPIIPLRRNYVQRHRIHHSLFK